MTAKKTLREIEQEEYTIPAADVLPTELADDGLVGSKKTLVAKLRSAGFGTVAVGFISHDLPDWRKRRPEDVATSWFSRREASVRVVAQRRAETGLVGVDISWHGSRSPVAVLTFAGWPPRVAGYRETVAEVDAVRSGA